ncbi:MAG: family 2 glycosyl transferase [Bacteroidota bacterium]|jgi:glycosyltransferase involved in cell wall biosynthesis|nr:family 2 glycosyl transferase [Bacteroidota bacterium]
MSSALPLISVIMPAYNCERYVKYAIDSILNQTHSHLELLIADDGSIDSTKKIIDSYTDPRIKTFHNTHNQGYLKTSNSLVRKCMGSFITFQDADDACHESRLELLLKEFSINPALGCVGSFVNRIDQSNNVMELMTLKCDDNEIKADLPYFFNCIGSALMVKKQVIDDIGLYEEYFDRCGSEDLYWFGLVAKKYETKNLPTPLYYYRHTPNSISNEINKSPKKQMSIEIVKHSLIYFYRTKKSLLKNQYNLKVLESYLIGKCYCWRKDYKKGLQLIAKSIFLNPFGWNERYSLLKTYLPKLVSKRG